MEDGEGGLGLGRRSRLVEWGWDGIWDLDGEWEDKGKERKGRRKDGEYGYLVYLMFDN